MVVIETMVMVVERATKLVKEEATEKNIRRSLRRDLLTNVGRQPELLHPHESVGHLRLCVKGKE